MENQTEIKERILAQLRAETGYVTTKQLIAKLGAKKVNARKIGRWLTREAEILNLSIVSKYGHNHYKLKTAEPSEQPTPETVQEPSMMREIFDSLKTAGIDVKEKLQEIRDKKMKELEVIDKAISSAISI